MLKSYLKVAFRNFVKEKFYSILNVMGLATGICVVLFIALFLYNELSYDRFHSKADRVYRLASHMEIGGNISDLNATFPPYAKALEQELSEVESAVRVSPKDGLVFKRDANVFNEDNLYYVDSNFFELFDYSLLYGDKKNALNRPYTVLINTSIASKLFAKKPLAEIPGESITISGQPYEITGIIADVPENSHMMFSSLASIHSIPQGRDETWNSMNLTTYVLLKEGRTISDVLGHYTQVLRNHLQGFDRLKQEGIVIDPIAHRLTDIHLRSNIQGEFRPAGSMTNIYIFGAVALIVLVLACVNFVNLVTARSANRAKEVGVRKVMGSASSLLRRQFLAESVLLVTVASLIALGAVELFRHPFETWSGIHLPFNLLISPAFVGVLLAFVIILGLAAGSYPAFFLASFKPADVLKGNLRSMPGSARLRNSLVVLQFVISIILITCTLAVQRQLDFLRSRKLGFDKENVLVIDNGNKLPSQETYLNDIRMLPFVKLAGVSTHRSVDNYDGMFITSEDDKENRKLVSFSRVDHDYLKVMNYELIDGRTFSREFVSDSAAVVLNESAATLLFSGDPVGKKLNNGIDYHVIGVVKDFHFESLRNEIRPLVFYLYPDQRFIHIRLQPGNHEQAIASLEQTWRKHATDVPFSFAFLDDSYNKLYKEEMQLGMLFSVFTVLALFIACLGLIGLAAYTAQQRKKEISVRKILGASMSMIVGLLSKQFLRLIFISFFISIPIAYMLINQWLESFAFKTDMPVYLMFAGGIVVMVVAFLAVSWQSVRAALTNPVDSLKEE
jgi:putative ABC transport system permease protein